MRERLKQWQKVKAASMKRRKIGVRPIVLFDAFVVFQPMLFLCVHESRVYLSHQGTHLKFFLRLVVIGYYNQEVPV